MSSSPENEWCLIESDPGVFTELIEMFGMVNQKVEVMEIYSLGNDDGDDDSASIEQSFQLLPNVPSSSFSTNDNGELQQIKDMLNLHCYGLIFLFEYNSQQRAKYQQQRSNQNDETKTTTTASNDIFFAQQITTNACATQALLSILMNTVHDNTTNEMRETNHSISFDDFGPTLTDLYNATKHSTSYEKGLAIQNNTAIRTAHNSFITATDLFYSMNQYLDDEEQKKKKKAKKGGDVFHFVAYVPINGIVYELDGLQSQPIVLGTYDDTNSTTTNRYQWLHVARRAIQGRMDVMNNSSNRGTTKDDVKFNLMAVTCNRRTQLQSTLETCYEILNNTTTSNDDYNGDSETTRDSSTSGTVSMIINEVMNEIENQNTIHDQYKLENQRRKHNYYNCIIQIIKELYINNQLKPSM